MAVSLVGRLAARAAVPVHAVAGAGADSAVAGLRAHEALRLVASPRHATILLVGGPVTDDLIGVVGHVHDQLPHPRGVVWWGGADAGMLGIDGVVTVEAGPAAGDVAGVLRRVHRELVTGQRPSTAFVGPADNPVAWQGEGPHGQGGEGMMGGRPYGRPMAMTGADVRDGLSLDRVAVSAGPALPGLPPGLRLDVELQGDVIQQADTANLLASPERAGSRVPAPADVFDAARTRPVPIADLETARARHHLLRVAQGLALHGLDSGARRVARLALQAPAPDRGQLSRVRRRLLRAPALWGATSGVGRVGAATVARLGLRGVAARAAGEPVDARDGDPAYRTAGFEVITRRRGDASARWLLRLDEASQALDLAAAAGSATTGPDEGVEDPRGDSAVLLGHLGEWLVGAEWGDAITTVASLDLDLEVAASRPSAPSAKGRR